MQVGDRLPLGSSLGGSRGDLRADLWGHTPVRLPAMTDNGSYTDAPEMPRKRHFAEVVSEAAGSADEPVLTELTDVLPTDPMRRQADLLETLRPRAIRGSALGGVAPKTSSLAVLRRRAVNAAMRVAAPLRDELDRILDYLDAVEVAYEVATDRVAELEERLVALERAVATDTVPGPDLPDVAPEPEPDPNRSDPTGGR